MAIATAATRPIIAAPTDQTIKMPSPGTVHVGGSKRIQIGGGHWVWTKKVGSGDIKVLLVHGGPGADHCYFECFEDFLPLNNIEFYYYDQLDSTNSEKPDYPKLWTIDRYTEEVEAVRQDLGWNSSISWGTPGEVSLLLNTPSNTSSISKVSSSPTWPQAASLF